MKTTQYFFCFISEAKIRFLKARLRVMQEELERMHTECVKRVSFLPKLMCLLLFFFSLGRRK
jgi:hypothetical protein